MLLADADRLDLSPHLQHIAATKVLVYEALRY